MIENLAFFDQISVLVVGDVMIDRYIWGDVRRLSPEAPVPVVEIERETHTGGGAANVALNLAALGVRCSVFGIVGDDANGAELRGIFAEHGIGFDSRLVSSKASTITKTRIIAQRQQICRLDQEAIPARYTLADNGLLEILAETASRFDAVILSDYAKGALSQPVLDRIRALRSEHHCFVSLDPKPIRPLEIGGLDLLTPNRTEALQLAGISTQDRIDVRYEEIARQILRQHRPECLVMTLSEHGMLLCGRSDAPRIVPTLARQVADVSGAGDTVVAVLTAAMAAGVPPEAAVHIANAAAGVVVGKLGVAVTTRAELQVALRDLPA